MHMYQGKGRWGSLAEVPALTWLFLNYEYQTCGKKRTRVHYISNQYTTMVTSSTSPRGAHHSTHAYLASFRSIHSSCLIIRYRFQVVHNRGHGYSNSLLTLQGCTSSHACHHLSPRSWHPSSECRTWMKPRHEPHITFSNPGVDYLSLSPLESPAGSTKQTQIM